MSDCSGKFNSINGAAIMNIKKFAVGDLVHVKGISSPTMKVMDNLTHPQTGETRVACVWFRGDDSLCEAAFPESILGREVDNLQPSFLNS